MEANLAVLIDFENIAAGTEKEGLGRFDVDALMKRVKDKGRILVARSYADWGRFARFKQGLLTANVNMYELTSHGMHDKNRADIAMVVDALDLAFTKDYIDTYVVVSGDSDFTPLVLKMRELNKRVIGVGTRSSTSRLLIQACDEFIFYDTIVEGKRRRERAPEVQSDVPGMTRETAWELLVESIEGLQRELPDPPHGSVVKTAMRRKRPDFSETDLGFASFARFLESAQAAGLVRVIRDEKAGGYRVALEASEASAARAPAPRRAEPRAADSWTDPLIPAGTDIWVETLASEGIHPLATPTRMAVLEAIVAAVRERQERDRRVTIQFLQEDLRKALRNTHADLPARAMRGVLTALMRANVLIHRDGTPVRTASAPFGLDRDAEQLNSALLNVYLTTLANTGTDLSDVDLLAELLLGNRDRRREVEEMLAWLQAQVDDDALEGLLTIEETDGDLQNEDRDPDSAEAARAAARSNGKAPRAPKAEAAPAQPAAPKPAAPEAAAEPEEAPKRGRGRDRRKGDAEVAAAAPAPKAEPAPPAKARAKAPAAPAAYDDLDALLTLGDGEPEAAAPAEEAEPAKKPARRPRKPRAKAE